MPLDERPKAETRPAPPKPEVPELGRVVTGKTVQAQRQVATATSAAESTAQQTPSVTTQDQWVRPSSVPRDRIRRSDSSRGKSEMEKAREIFAKAMEYSTDEEGTGVIETRMLRASEVRELMSDTSGEPTTTSTSPQAAEPQSVPVERTPQPARPATARAAPGPAIERSVTSLRSASANQPPPDESQPFDDTPSPPELVQSFVSSRYSGGSGGVTATVAPPVRVATAAPAEESELARGEAVLQEEMDNIVVCPNCGTVITKDSFEYEPAILSAMGEARLKQARFFVVQGQYNAATKALSIAKALFSRAGDANGLSQVQNLADSLSRGKR